jgi:outer membrane protein assembly factor BamC
MKFRHQLVPCALAVIILAGCSSNPAERRQAKDDFSYLDTDPLSPLVLPEGAEYEQYPNYTIPEGDYVGGVGREVDIRPPQQILELIPGARYEQTYGDTTVWLLNADERDRVWDTLLQLIDEEKLPIESETDQLIETGWVEWLAPDEEQALYSRHEFSKLEANGRFGFSVKLTEWKEGNAVKLASTTNRERYNTFMTNRVTSKYDQNIRDAAALEAEQLVKNIPISMGTDKSGLPVIIARTPYNLFWQRVPTLLPSMGFTIEERNQSQGQVKAKYVSPDDEFWQEVGVTPLSLDDATYTFLLGDLGNRTSINVTDADGKPITASWLEEMVPVIVHTINQEP